MTQKERKGYGLMPEALFVRSPAALTLEESGPEALDAAPALIEALSEYRIRETVVRVLPAIGGQGLSKDTAAWRQWWNAQQ